MSNKLIIRQVRNLRHRKPRLTYQDKESKDAISMGMDGLHYAAIAEATGLSKAQVAKRLKDFGVRVRDYRDGRSPMAIQMIQATVPLAHQMIEGYLKATHGLRNESHRPFLRVAARPRQLLINALQGRPSQLMLAAPSKY